MAAATAKSAITCRIDICLLLIRMLSQRIGNTDRYSVNSKAADGDQRKSGKFGYPITNPNPIIVTTADVTA